MANPNPSPDTRSKKGQAANPGGKTKEQKQLEIEAAEMAAKLRHKMLSTMMEKAEGGEDVLEILDAATLKLFKDSEDRAHGAPKQAVETKHEVSDPLAELLGEISAAGRKVTDGS